jgi:biopolymer transport protein ExbB
MKKLFTLFMACTMLMLFIGNYQYVQAQDGDDASTEQTEEVAAEEEEAAPAPQKEEVPLGMQEVLKKYFIDGGWKFMGIVLICLIIGLAICIERILMLNLATTNTNKLLRNVEDALKEGGIDQAKEVCKSTRGPVANIFLQGLERSDDGLDVVEKAIVSSGSVQMGKLESGLVWISLCIALAPMLGFMGTVIGMIEAFDAIEVAGDISPGLVAGGIKVALLTTVFGLVVAIILQVFYNYIVSKVDSIVNGMEESSLAFIDLLARNSKLSRR